MDLEHTKKDLEDAKEELDMTNLVHDKKKQDTYDILVSLTFKKAVVERFKELGLTHCSKTNQVHSAEKLVQITCKKAWKAL